MKLDILYQDEYIVMINKPNGLLVHKTKIAADAKEFALQILRDQLGKKVFPAHRLDRKTSGILIFSLDEKTDSLLQTLFRERKIDKYYLALVRGFTPLKGSIDTPLKKEDSEILQNALTHYEQIDQIEIDKQSDKRYLKTRYSLVKTKIETGRQHQIRRHLAKINHPIIGDNVHGDNTQNHFFEKEYGNTLLHLHAFHIKFMHPITHDQVDIQAPLPTHFSEILTVFGIKIPS